MPLNQVTLRRARVLQVRQGSIAGASPHTIHKFVGGTTPMLLLGLCCVFKEEPIRFRTATATAISKPSRHEQHAKLEAIALANA